MLRPRLRARHFALVTTLLAAGCQSAAIREKCATAASPAACEAAEYDAIRLAERQEFERRLQQGRGDGGGY